MFACLPMGGNRPLQMVPIDVSADCKNKFRWPAPRRFAVDIEPWMMEPFVFHWHGLSRLPPKESLINASAKDFWYQTDGRISGVQWFA